MTLYIKNNLYTKLAVISIIASVCKFYVILNSHVLNQDYFCFYAAAKFIHYFSLEALYNKDFFFDFYKTHFSKMGFSTAYLPWNYPPHYIFYVYPFSIFSYHIALVVFVFTGFILFGLSVWVWCKKADLTQNIVLYTLGTPVVIIFTEVCQNSFYTASFFLLGLHFLDKRPVLAGFFLSLLTYKPQFVLILPIALLLSKHYKVFFYAALFFALQVFSSIMVFGVGAWLAFFANSQGLMQMYYQTKPICDVMISTMGLLSTFDVPFWLAKIICYVWLMCTAFFTLFIWYIRKGDSLAKAILVTGICLGVPYVLQYDTIIMFIAILFLLEYRHFNFTDKDTQYLCLLLIIWVSLLGLSLFLDINLMILTPLILYVSLCRLHYHSLGGRQPCPSNPVGGTG